MMLSPATSITTMGRVTFISQTAPGPSGSVVVVVEVVIVRPSFSVGGYGCMYQMTI